MKSDSPSPYYASPERLAKGGFTLAEVLFVMAILGFIFTGVLGVTLQSQKGLFVSMEKTKINKDMRQFTGEMAQMARNANHFIIYSDFSSDSRDEITDRVTQGGTGDLLVLVFQKPHPTPSDTTKITRIIGYYRAAQPGELGPVQRFDIEYAEADYKDATTTTIESLLPAAGTIGTHTEVVEMTDGLANGNLFLNFEDRSIMIKGQIYHGNEYKRLTDTYNFTVTPRG